MTDFTDYNTALQFRDVIQQMVSAELDRQRPRYQYATVTAIDRTTRRCSVQFPGETQSVSVNMGSIQPARTGQVVRINGLAGDRFIEDVMGDTYQPPFNTTFDAGMNGILNLGNTYIGQLNSSTQKVLYWRKLTPDGVNNYEALQYLTAGTASSTLDTVLRQIPVSTGVSTELGRYGLATDGVFTATKGIRLGASAPAAIAKLVLGNGASHGTNYVQRYQTATWTAGTGVWTDHPWNSSGTTADVQDDGTIYAAPLFQSQAAGMYLMIVSTTFGTNTGGYRSVRIITEGGTVLARDGFDNATTPFRDCTVAALVTLPGAGYGIKAQVYQNSGTSMTMAVHSSTTPVSASFIQVA
jgi:hypothetical protein